MPESGEMSLTDRTPPWQWLSCLCLDAPLVAVSWSLLLGIRLGGPLSPLPHLGLGLAVWAVYLFDRIYDTRPSVSPPRSTERHRFARRHRRWMAALLVLAVAGGLALAPFLLSLLLIEGAALVGLGVLVYYACFRFVPDRVFPRRGTPGLAGRQRSGAGDEKAKEEKPEGMRSAVRTPRLPWKEAAVATCFTAGVALAAGLSPAEGEALFVAAAFWLLALANCLLVARAEAEEDRRGDRAAFFADGKMAEGKWMAALPVLLPPVFVLLAALFGAWRGIDRVLAGTLAGAATGLLLCLAIPASRVRAVSPFADAVLFLPPAIALVWIA